MLAAPMFHPRPVLVWAGLLFTTLGLVMLLEWLRQPAALLLGAMLAAVLLALAGGRLRLPGWGLSLAQGVVGCMIARSIQRPALQQIAQEWPVFVAGVLTVTVVSYLLGWLLLRWRVMPGTAAIWGASPGGATAMVVMAESYGADVRLVAFMQYLRVLLVAMAASLVASIWAPSDGAVAGMRHAWWAPVSVPWLAATLLLAASGGVLKRWLPLPAISLLLPLLVGGVLQHTAGFKIELPRPLLAISYALIGWNVGLRFSRDTLRAVARALPAVLLSTVSLLLVCGGLAGLLVCWLDLDPVSAYLAMSPGGVDSVAIIAASSPGIALPFVMAMQTARFMLVILIGPWLSRWLAAHAAHRHGLDSGPGPNAVRIAVTGAAVDSAGQTQEAKAQSQTH